MAYSADTIAALATPVGTSALAIVRASGPRVAELGAAIFNEPPLPRLARHGDYRDRTGTLIDDTVYIYFQAPNSYTGENILEISCHGNIFIINKILDDLFARGCRPAEPGEFTKRAFLNGRMDLSQAEAVVDLIRARSDRALAVANQQLRGSLGRHMQEMTSRLLDLLAIVEACIDFPEEDLPPENRSSLLAGIQKLLEDTGRLLATSHYGEMLRDGVKIVILGESNAGKSCLLNRLVGYERALVSSEPGTTRDYLEERIALGPHCIRLTDTAGLNASPTPLEKLGITKTMEQATLADLILLVFDATRPAPFLPLEILSRLTPQNTLVVINKTDLVPNGPHPTHPENLSAVKISALTGAGCDELVSAIVRRAESFRTMEFSEDFVAINARHANALHQAIECLQAAMSKTPIESPIELLASDLRGVLNAFGEILGKIDNERILDHIFAKFCIGK